MKKLFLIASVLFLFSKFIFSRAHVIDSLQAVIQKLPDDTVKLNVMYDISKQLVITGEYENAFKKIAEIESLIVTLSSKSKGKAIEDKLKSETARVLNLKGVIYSRQVEFKEALKLYLEALKIREELNDIKGIAMTCNNISGLYSYLGDNVNELKYLDLAIKNFETLNDKVGLGQAYYNQSLFFYRHSDYKKAIEANLKSQKCSEEIGDDIGVTHCLLHTGDVYREMGNLKLSTDYFLKALELTGKTEDKVTKGYAYNQLAINFQQEGNFNKAYDYFNKGLQLKLQMNDRKNIAGAYGNIGFLFDAIREDYLKKGETAKAKTALDSSVKYTFLAKQVYEEIGIKEGLPLILLRCGLISMETKEYKNAEGFLTKALALATELGNKDQQMWAYKYFSDLYAAKKENGEALKYYTLYSNLKDSILNESNSKSINELNLQFETEKKEQQIALLKKDNEIKAAKELRAKQVRNFSFAAIAVLIIFGGFTYYRYTQRKLLSEKLGTSLTELKQTQQQLIKTERLMEQENVRLRISRDIHDEIGSSLTKIALLSDMAIGEIQSKPVETEESLRKIADYSRNVNATLGEIIWAVNPQQDTLDRLLAYMRSYIHTFLNKTGIDYTVNFPEIVEEQVNPDLKRNIFLVLKESLNNSVKYSKAKNIKVSFTLEENRFELLVKDDGSGFDASKQFFSGNGLSNMSYRMSQHGCKLEINSSPGNGCSILAHGTIS